MEFDGFSAEGLAFLRDLPSLDKEAFQTERARYKATLQEPIKALVDALGPVLRTKISPEIQFAARTHGSIGPINNDVRFNPDAATYKDHVLLRFWEGEPKKTAPNLYVRITGEDVGFATGSMFADVDRWRDAIDKHGDEFSAALSRLRGATDAAVVGRELKRVPKPFDADHPHGDLLRHKWFQARWPRSMPRSVGTVDFVQFCADELMHARDVHRWLVERLGFKGA